MTEKNDERKETEKKIKPRKVTTGAWWKSAKSLIAGKKKEEPENTGSEQVEQSQEASKEKTVDENKEKTGNKKGVQKEKGPTRGSEVDASETGAQKKVGKSDKKRPARKKPQKTQGRKKESVAAGSAVSCKLLINAEEPEECRVALLENGRLEAYHFASVGRERTKNNIYKGRIVSVEPSLQAAFVEIGTDRNAFLPFADIHPEYFRQDISEKNRQLIAQHQWKKLKIEEVVARGQEVLVQVVKEVTGNKGANMTTYLSLPGRCLVLMPGSDSAGISRKIVGEERRNRLREMMHGFSIPEGIGYIVRTASEEITKTALQQDLRYLLRLWREIKKRGQTLEAPALIYEDSDVIVRFLRDHFDPSIREIQVDSQESFDQVKQFLALLPPSQSKVKVKLHRGSRPLFNQHNVEEQIESIYQPQVSLPSGGSIVIDPTEALVAIDVNSGRTSKDSNFEESIFLANMEAAAELARQLRLRDLGGLIVVDFIDMRNNKHIREVEKQVKKSMKRDKAKSDISRISRFGLLQISRQKMGAPIEKGNYRVCEHCEGRGVVKSVETLALFYLRRIQTGITKKKVNLVRCRLPLDVATYLLNKKRNEISELESKHGAVVDIVPKSEMKPADNEIEFLAK